jgi:hypothetical protein
MSATSPELSRSRGDHAQDHRTLPVRRSTETKASFKTTEFMAYVAMLAGLFIAGALTKAGTYGNNHDVLRADRVWLYAVILTVGYLVSRGFAKSGSPDRYTDDG